MAKRGVVLACLCFASLMLVVSQPSSTLAVGDEISVMTGWVVGGKESVYLTAIDKGWYKENNILLSDVMRGYGGMQTTLAVDQGKVTFAYSSVNTVILNRIKGGKVKIIGILLNHSQEGFVSLKEKGITKPKDMEGRTLGLAAATTGRQTLPVFCKINKIDCGKIEIITINPGLSVTSLLTGKVDSTEGYLASSYEVIYLAARDDGKDINWIGHRDWGMDLYGGGFLASEDTLTHFEQFGVEN